MYELQQLSLQHATLILIMNYDRLGLSFVPSCGLRVKAETKGADFVRHGVDLFGLCWFLPTPRVISKLALHVNI
jgi:hypothetical protein